MKIIFVLLLMPLMASARPVSFLEAKGLMVENRVFQSEIMPNYTFSPSMSAGIHFAQLRDEQFKSKNFLYGVLSFLPLRQNWDQWQANIYLTLGYGFLKFDSTLSNSIYASLEGDIESREYYFSIKSEGYSMADRKISAYSRFRMGFAPYLSEMNGLHGMIVFQIDNNSWIEKTDITPLLRLFYQNVLFEFGMSINGRSQINMSTEF